MNQSSKLIIFLMICFSFSCKKAELLQENLTIQKTSASETSSYVITTIYYVDNINGNDGWNGLSPEKPWKNISKVNTINFLPGNQILFKAGGSWTNRLKPMGSGTSGSPIVIGSYGTGARPRINGAGVADGTIYLHNQEYWEIRDIEVTNYKSSEEGGISIAAWEANNQSNYADAILPAQAVKNNSAKIGILISAADTGVVNHIHIKNVYVHGINGTINQASESSKDNGGIAFKITGSTLPTYFNNILVENCTISNVDRTGVFNTSTWDDRTKTTNINWTPSLNMVFRNNTFNNIGANALIVRVAHRPLMEYNLFDHCAIKVSGNAAFNFNTDWAKWQYNEARFTKANIDDRDAGGLDSDYRTKNTIIQYNYLHDNDYGMLVTGGGGVFNDSTQVKYNIIENDGRFAHPSHGKFALKVAGSATNTMIYNNVINISADQTNTSVIYHSQWTHWPANTSYYNNIIRNASTTSKYTLGSSTFNTFNYNIFDLNSATSQPTQVNNVTGSVNFVNPGAGIPDGYKLQVGSVALGAGMLIPNNGNKDYFGNHVSSSLVPNIGAYNGAGL